MDRLAAAKQKGPWAVFIAQKMVQIDQSLAQIGAGSSFRPVGSEQSSQVVALVGSICFHNQVGQHCPHFVREKARNGLPVLLDEVLAETFVNHSQPLPPDREGMKAFATEHRSEFPTGRYTIQTLVAEATLSTATSKAPTMESFSRASLPAEQRPASTSLFSCVRRIAERWAIADEMGLLVPLGYQLVPPSHLAIAG